MINYTGNSMLPTLKTGDVLRAVPYKDRKIRIGDVVAFRSPHGGTLIVHRVISFDQRGVGTKGDNSLAGDDWVLQPNDIIGRVVSVRRGKKIIWIFGGFQSRIYILALGLGKRTDIFLSAILRPAYGWFAQTGIFRKLFSRWISTRVSCFKREGGIELQLRLSRRIIGRLLPGQERWYVRRPFKLFIDESSLPANNTDDLDSLRNLSLNPSKEQS